MTVWHSASEPPQRNGSYIVVFNGESGFMDLYMFTNGKWYARRNEWTETDLLTHWTELPEWP